MDDCYFRVRLKPKILRTIERKKIDEKMEGKSETLSYMLVNHAWNI